MWLGFLTTPSTLPQGFSDLVPLQLLKVFDERELEVGDWWVEQGVCPSHNSSPQYLLGGLSQIDVDDWKKNTEYVGYTAHDDIIVWFWKVMCSPVALAMVLTCPPSHASGRGDL